MALKLYFHPLASFCHKALIIGGESGVRSDLIRLTDPQWARNSIAECRRVGAAPFLKQWGTYKNNPCVVEDGLTEQQAMKIDPPDNGKGGGKLDGRLWREFPCKASQLRLGTALRGRGAKNGSERSRAVYAG
jgi:protein gp37